MIKTYVSVQIGSEAFTFQGVWPDLGTGDDAAAFAAAALLRETADKLRAAIGAPPLATPDVRDRWKYVQRMDENGNRQCYLCGFYHDEPGSCATSGPTNITPGPDDEPEYDGPTMDYGEYIDDAEELDDDSYHGPEEGDYRESTFPTLDEILETGRPYDDDECAAVNGPYCDDDATEAQTRYADRVISAVVKASTRDEADQ